MSFRASDELEKRALDACREVGITKSQLLSELVEKGLGVKGLGVKG